MNFVVATSNKGKLKEIIEILKPFCFEVKSMAEIGFYDDIEENGSSFEENALIKARTIAKEVDNAIVMADDSGLEVDFLNGAPGIYSARYAGENATDSMKINKLLKELDNIEYEKRTARFVCAIAVVFPDGREFTVRGTCEGIITFEPRGANGFGYDPIFFIPQFNKTISEINSSEKNSISHRGNALKEMVKKLGELGV